MQNALRREIEPALNPGEEIHWIGVPDPIAYATASWSLFVIGLPFASFALYWFASASRISQVTSERLDRGFEWFPLLGLPFILFGLWMVLSPLFNFLKARKTVYFVTDQRAVALTGGRWKRVKSYTANDIKMIERVEKKGGGGHLYFAVKTWQTSKGKTEHKSGFLGLKDVQVVETHIRKLMSKRSDDAPAAR